MKLYATVTSERASKGQGGNDFLDIVLFYGDAKNSKELATISVKPVSGGYGLYLDGAMIRHSEQIERKCEKQ